MLLYDRSECGISHFKTPWSFLPRHVEFHPIHTSSLVFISRCVKENHIQISRSIPPVALTIWPLSTNSSHIELLKLSSCLLISSRPSYFTQKPIPEPLCGRFLQAESQTSYRAHLIFYLFSEVKVLFCLFSNYKTVIL